MKRTKMIKRTIRYRKDQLEFLQAEVKRLELKGVGTLVRILIGDYKLTQSQHR